jgi:hypothetical protein
VLRLRKKVDSGARLSDVDIHYFQRALSEAAEARLQPLLERHPAYAELVARLFAFYRQIADRALENEKRWSEAGR